MAGKTKKLLTKKRFKSLVEDVVHSVYPDDTHKYVKVYLTSEIIKRAEDLVNNGGGLWDINRFYTVLNHEVNIDSNNLWQFVKQDGFNFHCKVYIYGQANGIPLGKISI